jgi:murein L,D-transpeptidase YafK
MLCPRPRSWQTCAAILLAVSLLGVPACPWASGEPVPASARSRAAAARVRPTLEHDLQAAGLRFGDPVFLRIFKREKILEAWLREPGRDRFRHFRSWPVAKMSGTLGPKLAEGDLQAPEGFYHASARDFNPNSQFHLSFNLGYPNAYDRAHGRSGSLLMVHGSRVSVGCFAMTDPGIEQIYTLCAAALDSGQPFIRVHVFPFRMSDAALAAEKGHRWEDFWTNLKQGHDWFERHKVPPEAKVQDGRYVFEALPVLTRARNRGRLRRHTKAPPVEQTNSRTPPWHTT